MKINKLVADFSYDFDLYGITSADKDFKLAWHINYHLKISLSRNKDYIVQLSKGTGEFVNFLFTTESSELRLFKNKGVESGQVIPAYLVPEMKHFDYFILVKGTIYNYSLEKLVVTLKNIPSVILINHIDLESLKSKIHFMY